MTHFLLPLSNVFNKSNFYFTFDEMKLNEIFLMILLKFTYFRSLTFIFNFFDIFSQVLISSRSWLSNKYLICL